MNVTETRFANFTELYRLFREANATMPDRGMLKLFAEKLGFSAPYLSHVKTGKKPIGHATARQIEAACCKPEGWLDQKHGDHEARSRAERDFIETGLTLFRTSPVKAQEAMIALLKDVLKQVVGHGNS